METSFEKMQRQSFEGLSILSQSGANGKHGFKVRGRAPPLHGFETGVLGSYFGKGTLSASGRGDEKNN